MSTWAKYILTEEEETKLADDLLQMSEMGYGLTQEGVMGLAYSLVEISKHPHPFTMEVLEGPGLKVS